MRPARLRPLGAIIFDLEKALRIRSTPLSQLALLEDADRRYGRRLDYRLWRGVKTGFKRGGVYRQLHATQLIQLQPDSSIDVQGLTVALRQRAGRGSKPRLQAWGLLALVAAEGIVLSETRPPGLIRGNVSDTLELLDEIDELPLMAELPWGCFLAGTVARAKLLKHIFGTRLRSDVEPRAREIAMLDRCLTWTCGALKLLDPYGEPTGAFPLRGFEREEDEGLRLVPVDTIKHGLRSLAWALGWLGFQGQRRLPEENAGLAGDVFRAASGAWRILRWQRIMLERDFPGDMARGADASYFYEMQALSYAAKAAMLAGETFRSAGLHWVYQTHYADKPPIGPKSATGLRLERWQFSAARQVGIEPHPLFEQPGWKPERIVAPMPGVSQVERRPTPELKRSLPSSRLPVVQRRFWSHRDAHPELWRPLEPHIMRGRRNYGDKFRISNCLAALGESLEKRKINGEKLDADDIEVVESLFHVFLDNDFLRSTINMLYCLDEVSVNRHILPPARRISEAIRVNKIAVSSKFMNEFIERVLGAWEKCPDAPIAAADRVMLHELVLGRYSAIYSTVSAVAYRELLRPRLTPGERPNYLAILNSKADAFYSAPPQPEMRDLEEFSRSVGSTELGRPLIVSLVPLRNGTSFVYVGSRAGSSAFFAPRLKLGPATDRMLSRRDSWFRVGDELCPPRDQVFWPPEFLQLRRRLTKLARANGARWLMLAVDPELACLPWQHLMSFAEDTEEDLLVTLCPSLGWGPICTSFAPYGVPRLPLRLICDSDDPAVEGARAQMADTLRPEAQVFDIGVVLGHGTLSSVGGAPEIMIGSRALNLEDMCRLNRHEVAVVHSCWTGSAIDPRPWGDGLLMSHVLGRNCRAVIAPIGVVAPEAIAALQHALTRPNDAPLGSRYLKAIRACANVSLYNLYGLASVEPRPGLYESGYAASFGTHLPLGDDGHAVAQSLVARSGHGPMD